MEDFHNQLKPFVEARKIPRHAVPVLENFYATYLTAGQASGYSIDHMKELFYEMIKYVAYYLEHPFTFEPYHQRVLSPFDFYRFGLDFIKPLIVLDKSRVYRPEILDRIVEQLNQGDNVILLANHQTEPDPQVISILLEKDHPKLAEEMIFVAGHRVTSDPLAIPFSMGRNLLCIYSKNYIENPPEHKPQKVAHNQKTMRKMSQLLSEGGKCIYVAPSGGRDRPNEHGKLEVSKFDPNSIEMFWLMAQQSDKITHFYPLTLVTYHLLPPPNSIQKDLGEIRTAKSSPVQLSFGEELDMEDFGEHEPTDKKHRRKKRAEYIWKLVNEDYHRITRHGMV